MVERKSPILIERTHTGPMLHDRVDALTFKPLSPLEGTRPLIFIPGYMANANPRISKNLGERLSSQGRETHIIGFDRYYRGQKISQKAQDKDTSINKPNKKDPSVISFNQAVALLEYIDANGIEKADLAAHSFGMQAALYAVAMAPERFANVIGVTPTGISKKYPMEKLTRTFLRQSNRDMKVDLKDPDRRRTTAKFMAAGGRHMLAHPLRVLLYERKAVQGTGFTKFVKRCIEDPQYPNLKLLLANRDSTFGPESTKIEHEVFPGRHNDILSDRWTDKLHTMLLEMDQEQKAHTQDSMALVA